MRALAGIYLLFETFCLLCVFCDGDSIDFSSLKNAELSCLNAQLTQSTTTDFCPYVDWVSANVYTSVNYTYYTPGQPLSDSEQRSYALYLYTQLGEFKSYPTACHDSIIDLACVSAFPFCPASGNSISSVSYLRPCKLQCTIVNEQCKGMLSLDCSSYPSTSCSLYIDSTHFVLSPKLGPFWAVAIIYIVAFVCWLFMAVFWHYLLLYPYREIALPICRAVSTVPYLKVVVLILGVSFWVTCAQWGECSFWLGVAFLNAQIIYDGAQMVVLILIAKGWSITSQVLYAEEWRNIIMLIAGFYISNAVVIVLQQNAIPTLNFLVAVGVLYGVMYAYIAYNTLVNVGLLRRVVGLFTPAMPEEIIGPSKNRYYMYVSFLVLAFISMSMEIVSHALITSGSPMWIVLLVYEMSNVLLFFVIGYIYRPQEYSPYFFLVPVRVTDERLRPLPLVETFEESADPINNYDLELASLLGRADEPELTIPRKVIMIKNPNNSIAVGVTT